MGRTTSILLLTRRGSLRVATTVPTTFPRSILCEPGVLRAGSGLGGSGFADRQCILEVRVRPRDDVYGDELAYAACRRGARVGRGFDGRDVASHDGGDI